MAPPPGDNQRPRVGLLYDERMCAHTTPDGEIHPECPERIRAVWKKLESEGIPQRCVILDAKIAEDKHIAYVHSGKHIKLIKRISSKEFDSRRQGIASKFNSIYLNKGSSEAAYLAAGSVIEVSEKVAKGDINSGIAIVRPPGHHAEPDEAMGFCLFNNVAIAASYLLNEKPELGIKKILIVDWDVHHGNGTQKMFYDDPRVLFFSVHRFDYGSFYPGGDDGAYFMIGDGPGAGYNINIPWEHGQCGDPDYVAAWDHVLIPVAEAYNPDIVLVSAGFDAAIDDPLGGCCVTPYGYSLLLEKLMRFAQGKIVMSLEGGYNLNSIANSVLSCAKILLHEEVVGSICNPAFVSTWDIIKAVRHELKGYWPALNIELPQSLLAACRRPRPHEMTRMITTMTRRDVLRNLLREAIQEIEYDSAHGVGWHIERLDRLFWRLEMQEFPILDNYRIWALIRSLPKHLSDIAHQIWGRYEGRISYTQLCAELLHYEDYEVHCEEDSEEDPEEDPKEVFPKGSLRVCSLQNSTSWHHLESISAEGVLVQPKKIGHVWIITALVFVLVGVIIAYLVY